MEKFDIYRDLVERTHGQIFIGMLGAVRTGKSTFAKKFMELLVLPNIEDPEEQERTKDCLPQSGAGRMITTVEPKFIPEDGVSVTIKDNINLKVRLIDGVGYIVDGAQGYEDEEGPRMVMTPWYDYEIPFEEAAEVGTRKIMSEHSTLGLVVTTDGSITDIHRESYVEAERRIVEEIKEIGKPFAVLLNSAHPTAPETVQLAAELEAEYDVPVIPVSCLQLTLQDIENILEQVLYEFPINQVNVRLPLWVEELESGHWLRRRFEDAIRACVESIQRLRDVETAAEALQEEDFIAGSSVEELDLGSGTARITLEAVPALLYQVLEEMTGVAMEGDHSLVRVMRELVYAKKEYEKVAEALADVREKGYGVVPPQMNELIFEDPELIKRGNQFAVKLRAGAPSIHMIRADIQTEVTPIIGTERQCEELVSYILEQFEEDPTKLWKSDIFGKSLHDLVTEGVRNKLVKMPDNAQEKLRETLQRIINEGSGGLICIII